VGGCCCECAHLEGWLVVVVKSVSSVGCGGGVF